MGLLSAGEPLDWEDMAQWQEHVRKYGVQQFIRLYNRLKVNSSNRSVSYKLKNLPFNGNISKFIYSINMYR
jgi:hypothetical protein